MKIALIQRETTVAASGARVGALVLTTLLPGCPKLMVNAQTDDYATVTERDCGCWLGEMGLRTHLSGIRSYEKQVELVELLVATGRDAASHRLQISAGDGK